MSDSGTPEVRTIKFKALGEDYFFEEYEKKAQDGDRSSPEQKSRVQSNFSLEYSYPAVIFDKVCFTVNDSKHQANFLSNCLNQARSFLKFWSQDDSSNQQIHILKSINLNVPYGSIFGLLGPSSCGKTTLLRCLVGLLEHNSGCIRLFCKSSKGFRGKRGQRSVDSKVPGANVGYMPQDLGLYEDFTICQLLSTFGRYMKMDSELIATRIKFMAEFLDLPDVTREINSLSGGQKRRVSFAIACLHMPPLIILDEPTVGVDPLLRQSIWKYLRRLADEENKTIIITTHYIEEAAQADQVALMRAGEILIQDTPKKIMESNGSKTLEEAFLKICNNVNTNDRSQESQPNYKLYPQPKFNLHDELELNTRYKAARNYHDSKDIANPEMILNARDKLDLFDCVLNKKLRNFQVIDDNELTPKVGKLSMTPNVINSPLKQTNLAENILWTDTNFDSTSQVSKKSKLFNPDKKKSPIEKNLQTANYNQIFNKNSEFSKEEALKRKRKGFVTKVKEFLIMAWALLYKNYRRNVNSLPLLAFQFMLPMIQMISFSLCVGGKPTSVGLGLVNHDNFDNTGPNANSLWSQPVILNDSTIFSDNYTDLADNSSDFESLSLKYLSFIDHSMIKVIPYDNIKVALEDVRISKLWAVMEIGENFTETIIKRFDLDNFYQLDIGTLKQSVIKLYPDRSNKVLDMICHRSLITSYRNFLLNQFEHFKRLPIEVKEPIFSIEPNLISNSIDGYTESIAAGLLASLTYIMAAGLTTFIMVVERSSGILERTYTSGINPVAYLIAHAAFRTFAMMIQIAVVMFLTFYILKQPLVGSIWLAYAMLMTLNLTGISYGLLVSSLVTDQNGAALTIVSSLVVKITLSGILWPFEAIPRWLRSVCYIQPLTMPIQALKAITLKGYDLNDRTVQLGFLVSISWLLVFLTISAKRFKFYQH